MKEYELTPLEREVFGEMARRNGTDTEMICKTCIHNDRMYRFHYFADRSRPPLTDISPLVRLEGLMRVEIYQCDIRDLSPLTEIPTLESITVSGGSELLPCDFTPLKKLGGLSLHYDCCNVPKLTGLPLKTVSLSRIESLEGLAGLGQLAWLNLHNNPELGNLGGLRMRALFPADCVRGCQRRGMGHGGCGHCPLRQWPGLSGLDEGFPGRESNLTTGSKGDSEWGKRDSREVWQWNADSAAGYAGREEEIVLCRFYGGRVRCHGLLE